MRSGGRSEGGRGEEGRRERGGVREGKGRGERGREEEGGSEENVTCIAYSITANMKLPLVGAFCGWGICGWARVQQYSVVP